MPESTETNAAAPNHTRKKAIVIMTIIFLLIGLAWFLYWFMVGRFSETTDDAYVNGNMVELMSQISGTVTKINVDDTQLVKEGQVLIQFDPVDTSIALQHAEASLAETVRQVRQLYENVLRERATVVLQKADLVKAELDLKRRQGLVGVSAISREDYQHYQTDEKTAQAQYAEALHQLQAAEAIVSNSDIYHHPLVLQAEANLKTAFVDSQRVVIRAPVTGYVAKRSVQVGQHVMVNTPMLSIIPLKEIWVDANYKESQLDDLRIGQSVSLYADAYPGVTYHGKVFGLNAGTGAVFSLLPPQNATGNWIKIVQRLPVRIWIDPNELKQHPLQLGLSMHVTTDIRDTKGPMLAQTSGVKPLYQTNIYAQQLERAHQLIETILKTNSSDMSIPKMENNNG